MACRHHCCSLCDDAHGLGMGLSLFSAKIEASEENYMAEIKKVKVCKRCSGFDVEELKGKVKTKDYTTGCIGQCAGKHPELAGKVYGFLNGEFTVCENKEDFLAKVAEVTA
jgi:hypothetical protein